MPYNYSTKDGIPKEHFSKELDLAQTIFGYANKDNALKGRIQFSHFQATSNILELQERKEVLGTPRASYYPMYIKQQGTKPFTTFMDNTFQLSGRKRYPIHKGSGVKKTEDTGNTNVGTAFKPLKDGVIFQGKLRYHNLKRVEVGAILSALTFHNSENCFHNIGLAKSLGYGKISIKLDGIDDINSYLKEFELAMIEQIENWTSTTQLKELLSMATEQNNSGNSKLEYMGLTEFADNKSKTADYLRNYTALDSITTINIKSLISQQDIEDAEKKRVEFEEKQKEMLLKLKEEEKAKIEAEKQAVREAILKQEKDRADEIKKDKEQKSQGLNSLKSCKNFKDGMKIINDSLGKKPKSTKEQLEVIRNFYNKCKDKKTKQIEKFFKKF